jgi:hypothetical protein
VNGSRGKSGDGGWSADESGLGWEGNGAGDAIRCEDETENGNLDRMFGVEQW